LITRFSIGYDWDKNIPWRFKVSEGKTLGWNSQNVLQKFVRICLTLGLKILRLLTLKVVFDEDIIKD